MLERPADGERVVLVHVPAGVGADPQDLAELHELAVSAGADVVGEVTGQRVRPDPRLYVGAGKADEIQHLVAASGADVVLFNHDLSPAQERNLERRLQTRVLDRAGLILDIFAQRARSFEGKLQVELAQLRHLSTRLVRGWTHLERQKGGIGLRGPGETQLETDRRLIGLRIKQLLSRLSRVRKQRDLGRRARKRAETPTVSLVGYTNAGKSTLFNRLTAASVYTADQLFATLDPTLRRLDLPDGSHLVLADTVGFIRHLPHELVAAFHATLEETRQADLLLHIIDVTAADRADTIAQVHEVLESIGADEIPRIEVYNKIDATEAVEPVLDRDAEGRIVRVWLSAATGDGIELLLAALVENFRGRMLRRRLRVPPEAGRLRARVFELGRVLDEQINERGEWLMDVELRPSALARLERQEGFSQALQT